MTIARVKGKKGLTLDGEAVKLTSIITEMWCSGLTYRPVTAKNAGSNPVISAPKEAIRTVS